MDLDPVPASALASPYFLLSYPHTPYNGDGDGSDGEPDFWVERFFKDLCRALEELGVPHLPKLGVFDRDLWVGNDWLTGLPAALATCRALVPLCAPRYFQSLACGKEWAGFTDRPVRSAGPDEVAPIVPVMWKPMTPGELPAAARLVPLEYWGCASYAEFGLESIIMRDRHRADYKEVVRQVAQRVKEVAEWPAPPCGPVDYDELSSPFAPGPMPGDRPLRITVVALCGDDLPPGRGKTYYGSAARDWNPYLRELTGPTAEPLTKPPEPIARYVANFARSQGFRPYVGDLGEHGPQLLSGGPPTAPELLIVDPWAVAQPGCERLLARANLSAKPWVQVVIPWNRDDRELAVAEDRLRQALDDVLGRKLDQVRVNAKLAAEGVPTIDDFSIILPDLMLVAKKNYFRYAEVPLPGGPPLPGFLPDSFNPLERTGG